MRNKEDLLAKLEELSTQNKKYLYVPYSEKDRAKQLGSYWDANKKLWWCRDSQKELFEEWFEEKKKIYLKTTYDQRHEVKALGCRWSKDMKMWYCFESNLEALEKFRERSPTA